jgi:hypothetical protein
MSNSDHFSTTASLESALEAEKASHTDTLVKLRLTEERLAASEAERHKWRTRADEAIKLLSYFERVARRVLRDEVDAREFAESVIIGNGSRCYEDEKRNGECYCSAVDPDEPTDSDAAVTLVMNERPGE